MNKYKGRIWIREFLDMGTFSYDSRFNIKSGTHRTKSKFIAGMTP